jgi:hypothetical protein
MKLDDFVAETLKQIIKGVVTAQQFGDQHNAKINPNTARFYKSAEGQAYCHTTGIPLQQIVFDIAVSISEEHISNDGDKTVGSISVLPMNSSSAHNTSTNRIKFQVPILLPATDVLPHEK